MLNKPGEMVVVMSVKERDEIVRKLQDLSDMTQKLKGLLDGIDDLDRAKELLKADKEGRCVILPCKVGEEVYEVGRVNVESRMFYPPRYRYYIHETTFTPLSLDYSEFGSRLFTDYEEALKVLKEKEKAANESQ